jgi:hypothetical protein
MADERAERDRAGQQGPSSAPDEIGLELMNLDAFLAPPRKPAPVSGGVKEGPGNAEINLGNFELVESPSGDDLRGSGDSDVRLVSPAEPSPGGVPAVEGESLRESDSEEFNLGDPDLWAGGSQVARDESADSAVDLGPAVEPRAPAVEGETYAESDDASEFELSLDNSDANSLEESDSDSEFELSLDESRPRSLAVEGESVETDFIETDFDVVASEEERSLAVEGETGGWETGSQVVVIEDEEDPFLSDALDDDFPEPRRRLPQRGNRNSPWVILLLLAALLGNVGWLLVYLLNR